MNFRHTIIIDNDLMISQINGESRVPGFEILVLPHFILKTSLQILKMPNVTKFFVRNIVFWKTNSNIILLMWTGKIYGDLNEQTEKKL